MPKKQPHPQMLLSDPRPDSSPWVRGFVLLLLGLVLLNALIRVHGTPSVPWIRIVVDFLGLAEIHRTSWILVIAGFAVFVCLKVLSRSLGKDRRRRWISLLELFEEGRPRNALAIRLAVPLEEHPLFDEETWKKETRSGETQWISPRGRAQDFSRALAALAFAAAVVASAASLLTGFTGVFAADEESRISIIESRHGRPPRGWSRWRANGLEIPDIFVAPSFFQLGKIDVEPGSRNGVFRSIRSLFRIGSAGEVREHLLVPGRPLRVGRWFFFQGGLKVVGPVSVKLVARDRLAQHELVLPKTPVNGEIELNGARVKILSAEKSVDEMGAAVQLRYVEGNGEPGEQFWIFEKRPEYDAMRRLGSRYAFSVDTVDAIYRGEIVVMRDLAAWVVLGALIVFLVAMAGVLYFPSETYRAVQGKDGAMIIVSGAPLALLRMKLRREIDEEARLASV